MLLLLAVEPGPGAQVAFHDSADREAFRRWFVLLADAQFYRATADVTDCAALVRHAAREALRSASPDWRRRTGLPPGVPTPAAVRGRAKEQGGALRLFLVDPGPPPRFAEFADARTLVSLNSHPLGRDLARLRPGDLLYFRQEGQAMPDHVMVFVGPSAFEADGRDWVVYHTGPSAPHPAPRASSAPPAGSPDAGEVRKVRLADLLRHPSPAWRPTPGNPRFVGAYRLALDADRADR